MINTSNEYKQTILGDNRKFYGGATITLLDGMVLPLDNSKITTIKINDATSPSGQFSIGSAIVNKLTLSINNMDDAYSDYDFTGAVIRPTIGLQLSSTIETLHKGVFTADDPKVRGSVISLTALDNMTKFDKPFKDVTIAFPTTAQLLLSAVCNHCGVVLATNTFTNSNYAIATRPIDDAINCREIVSWIAQISGNFARCNNQGSLELKWYDIEVFEQNALDGGIFDSSIPYSTGDVADGGNFTDYSSGDSIDGGTFIDMKRYHHIFRTFGSNTIVTDDVVITGIQVTDSSETPTTVLYGQSGYVISLDGNKLIQSQSDAQMIANTVGAKIVGMRFRPLTVNALSDPSREAGDVAYVSDRKGNSYQAIISNYTFGTRQHDKISSDAEPPSRNNAIRYSETAKAIVEARKYTQAEISAYDLEMQRLTNLMTYSFGVHKTETLLPDGSTIYYMHDKPTLAESMKIWKMTADAFAVSSDGGITWNAGFDVNGNVIVNILSAVGVRVDWLVGDKLLSKSGKTLIDMEKGVANSDNINVTDNVADGYPLRIPFNIDEDTGIISKVRLKWSIDKFRTYSTTASSGGGSTQTSGNGGGSYSSSGSATVPFGNSGTTFGPKEATFDGHTHGYSIIDHYHNVSTPDHAHSVSIPNHEHGLNFGIMETIVVHNLITIRIDGVDRTSVNDLQGIIDLTQWITTTGWHTIELYSATLKRISAQLNIKSYIQM